MIIAIWTIGIMIMWLFTLWVFNSRGYWVVSRFILLCVVWSMAVGIYAVKDVFVGVLL